MIKEAIPIIMEWEDSDELAAILARRLFEVYQRHHSED
jgi:hypothetical protein